MIGPGANIAKASEIGVGTAIGIRTTISESVKIKPHCGINHGVLIEKNCVIGSRSFVGLRAIVREGIELPPASTIPAGAVVETKEDVESFISSESKVVMAAREEMANLVEHQLAQ